MASGKRISGEAPETTPDVSSDGETRKPATPGSRRPKRPAPTIDLRATEVSEPVPPPAAASEQKPEPESKPETGPGSRFEKDSGSAGATSDFSGEPSASGRQGLPRFAARDAISVSTLAAGLVGGLLVSVVLFVLWLTGMVPIRYAGTTAMRARVSVLEMQMQELSGRTAPDPKSAEELSQRIGKLEQAPQTGPSSAGTADPKLLERIEAAENAMKSLGVALAAINGRVDANAARVEATELAAAYTNRATATSDGALGSRVDALEKSAAAAESQLAKATAGERSARLAVTASALRDAVVAGEPFAGELAAVKSLGADAASVAPLESFAASGIPRDAVLARDLSALLPQVMKLSGVDAPTSGGFLDKLQANASKLVRVRPAGDTAASDPASIVARLEQKAAQGDIASALVELKALPATMRAPAEGWIKHVEARKSAIEASRKLAADSFRALQ